MKIAWNEIKYQPKKFILIELLIIILMFMVVFFVRSDKWTGSFGIGTNR